MRKKKAPKRYVQPDPKFGDVMVSQFVNRLMWSGKKSTAYEIFYGAIDIVEERTKENRFGSMEKSIQQCKPFGRSTKQKNWWCELPIPTEVRGDRKHSWR
jgi:small subunit ribosomal protein S7